MKNDGGLSRETSSLCFVVIIFDLAIFGAIFYAENLVYTQYPEYEFPFFDW